MDIVINGSSNSSIKEIKKLSKKKYRNKTSLFIIETRKMIEEAIRSNMKIEKIFIRDGEEEIFEKSTKIASDLFNEISSLVTPDGYMAIVKKNNASTYGDRVLILDNLQDPGNVGTLIRSAEAFGYDSIIAINSCDFYNEKVLRASMGSIFRLNLVDMTYKDLSTLDGYKFLIADMSGKDYNFITLEEKIAIVIGNEGNGISKDIRKLEHILVKIPMKGKIESLNAGVSGSILMSKFS